jgi:hypothetical protein
MRCRYAALQRWRRQASSDEARRIGKAIARITEFMMPRQGFYSRVGAPTARTMSTWKTRYIREHWDEIYAPSQG